MSKSLRNYPDVSEVFDRDGSDAMRWFLMASPILRGGNLIVTEQGIREAVRQVLLPLWNAYSFLALYAPKRVSGGRIRGHLLDRYILAKLAGVRDGLTAALDVCDISGACEQLRQFVSADQLVCAAVAVPVLGRRSGRDRHLHRARSDVATGRALCCRWPPKWCGATSPVSGRCTSPIGPKPAYWNVIRNWWHRWTRFARCAR